MHVAAKKIVFRLFVKQVTLENDVVKMFNVLLFAHAAQIFLVSTNEMCWL